MVRSIEVQQAILQTSTIEKIQQVKQQQSNAQQDYLALQVMAKKNIASKEVQDSSASEKTEIKEREKKPERNTSRRRHGQAGNPDEEKVASEMDRDSQEMGRFIDIKI